MKLNFPSIVIHMNEYDKATMYDYVFIFISFLLSQLK